MTDDTDDLLHDGIAKSGDPVAELAGVLDNLLRELRAHNNGVNKLGFKVNVAMRVAENALRRHASKTG